MLQQSHFFCRKNAILVSCQRKFVLELNSLPTLTIDPLDIGRRLALLISSCLLFVSQAISGEPEKIEERNSAFFDGFFLREKYSPTLLKKKYFDYQYEFLEKKYIEGPPTHQFRQGEVNKKFVFGEQGTMYSRLRFIKFDNVYTYEDVIKFYARFAKANGDADLVFTKDYFWAKGFHAEWIRDDGRTTEILDATYRETLAGVVYEVSHYLFENSQIRTKADLKVPRKHNNVKYETYDPKFAELEIEAKKPAIRNREITQGSQFDLNLAGVNLKDNLAFKNLKVAFPGMKYTSTPQDFAEYRYASFMHEKCEFEFEYHFEEIGKVSTIYMRSIEIGHSHQLLNRLLQSNDKPFLAYTRTYKKELRQPENWLYYLDEENKQMCVIRLCQDFMDKNRFQLTIDIREYDSKPVIPKETMIYTHKEMPKQLWQASN